MPFQSRLVLVLLVTFICFATSNAMRLPRHLLGAATQSLANQAPASLSSFRLGTLSYQQQRSCKGWWC